MVVSSRIIFSQWIVRQSCLFLCVFIMSAVSLTNLADIPCGKQVLKGMRNPKIIAPHGETFPGELPWMVSIKYKNGDHFCGGFLINKETVLSASHCFDSIREKFITLDMIKVTVGEYHHFMAEKPYDSIDFNITKLTTHPNYNGRLDNDIAILKLENPVEWTPFVQPLCLPEAENKISSSPYGRGLVAGWGQTGETKPPSAVLRQVSLPILENSVCQKRFNLYKARIVVNDFQICAGELLGGAGDCQGDSGGPLMIKSGSGRAHQSDEQMSVVGIVSFGLGCARLGLPGIYTRIAYYLPWIVETVSKY